jgi:hypothetical protein
MSTLLVTGAGSLAESTLSALSQQTGPIEMVAIVARDSERLRWLARATRARSELGGSPLRVGAYPLDWEDRQSLAALLSKVVPDVVLHTASWQSPWTLGGQDAWSALVREIGYGVTLPLQRVLAQRLGQAVAEHVPNAAFVNACFPDAVNPLLARRGITVACGIGNVAILATMLGAELVRSAAPLRIVAHHAHVVEATIGRPAPNRIRGWRGERVIDDEVTTWIAGTRLPTDHRLNAITGAAAVPLLQALADGSRRYSGHAPGPLGLWGGYPISVERRVVALDLPVGLSAAEAKAHNIAAAVGDGILTHDDGQVGWSPKAVACLEAGPTAIREALRSIFDDVDVEASGSRLRDLRDRLTSCRS